jgi:hypothetical protein
MVRMIVFVSGEWIQVDLPSYLDPSWSESDRVLYATALAKARAMGDPRPSIVAEAIVTIARYPSTSYDSSLMDRILAVRDGDFKGRVGKA